MNSALSPHSNLSIDVPADIWEEIGEVPSSLSQKDFSCLRLTCKLFSEIFAKMVFRELRHEIRLYDMVNRPGHYLHYGFPPAAALRWTQSYVVHADGPLSEGYKEAYDNITDKHFEDYQTAINLFTGSLRLFSQLRHLVLGRLELTEELITNIASLLPLKTIMLSQVTFPCRSVASASRIIVESLEIGTRIGEDPTPPPFSPLHLFSNERLKTLVLMSSDEGPNLLTSLAQQGPCEQLTRLDIGLGGLQDLLPLFPFLAACPKLEDIEIEDEAMDSLETSLPPDVLRGLSISSAALPRLCKVKCPSKLAPILVPGRPVSSLEMHFPPWTGTAWEQEGLPILKNVSRSSARIQVLRLDILPARPEVFTTIAAYFPHLLHLQLFLDDSTLVLMEEGSSGLDDCVSTINVDDEGNPLSSPNSIRGLVERLTLGSLNLPPSIQELIIYDTIDRREYGATLKDMRVKVACMTQREQHHAVCALSKLYPSLSTVALAFGAHWIQDNTQWRLEFQRGLWIPPWP